MTFRPSDNHMKRLLFTSCEMPPPGTPFAHLLRRHAPNSWRNVLKTSKLLVVGVFLVSCSQGEVITNLNPELDPAEIDRVRVSRTFTSQTDWQEGAFDGVNDDSTGQIQMTPGLRLYETPYIWIPNSIERTVSKVDTQTREVLGTFPLVDAQGEDCWNPSRTTVDIDGNVWVGCRGNASYINTDEVANKTVPQEVDYKVVKIAKDDGRVLLSVPVGYGPRALAIDANNHVWVGCSVDDTIWEIDGDTGECYRGDNIARGGSPAANCAAPQIDIDDFPYGNAVDQRGHLWVVNNRIGEGLPDLVTEIDTANGQVLGVYGPFTGAGRFTGEFSADRGGCNDLYGIAIDQLNDIWLGGFGCDDVVKLKGVTGVYHADGLSYQAGELVAAFDIGGEQSRGLAIDLDGNVWVAMSGTGTATKINNATGAIMQTLNVGSNPIGVGVDAYGNAWVVNRGSDSVHWVNGLHVEQNIEIAVGDGPYTYSDMLGMALRTITHRAEGFANWKGAPIWEDIHWSAAEPENTKIRVRTRCAADELDLATAPWGEFMDEPGPVDCAGHNGRWAQVETRFYSNGTTASPVLFDLTVYWRE